MNEGITSRVLHCQICKTTSSHCQHLWGKSRIRLVEKANLDSLSCYRDYARGSNQSILKETNSEYSLKALILKLKLQSFGHPTGRADSLEKTLMMGNIEGWRRRG